MLLNVDFIYLVKRLTGIQEERFRAFIVISLILCKFSGETYQRLLPDLGLRLSIDMHDMHDTKLTRSFIFIHLFIYLFFVQVKVLKGDGKQFFKPSEKT